jgi:hypothetical protein
VGEKTGEEIGEISKDETALFLLLTREREGDERGDTSCSDDSKDGIFEARRSKTAKL